VKVNRDQLNRLLNYLDHEIDRAEAAREGQLSQYRLDDEFYDATPREKTFPWRRCSNVRIPLIRISTDSVVGRVQNTVEQSRPVVTARATRKEAIAHTKATQRWFDNVVMRPTEMDLHACNSQAIPRMVLRGTSPVFIPYIHDEREVWGYDAANHETNLGKQVLSSTVRPEALSHEKVLYPPEARTVQAAPWWARIFEVRRPTIKRLSSRGGPWRQDTWNQVKAHSIGNPLDESSQAAQSRQGIETSPSGGRTEDTDYWRFYEIHLRFDPKDDGSTRELVIIYHREARWIAMHVLNWYWHRLRPFILPTYQTQPNTLWPYGIGRKLRGLNIAIDTMINQSIDNSTMLNAPFFKFDKNEPFFRKGFEFWPGRAVPMVNPKDGLAVETIGTAFSPAVPLIGLVQQYAERDSGISDLRLGMDSALKSAVPATSTLAVMQEGSTKIDNSIRDFRSEYNLMFHMALANYQQFNPVGKIFSYLSPEDATLVEELSRIPPELVRAGMDIELTATSAAMNREVKRQSSIALMQILTQYYSQVISLGQTMQVAQATAPQWVQAIGKILDMSAKGFVRVLDDFEVPDSEEFAITMEDVFAQLGTASAANQIGAGAGGNSPVSSVAAGAAGAPRAESVIGVGEVF
jgi:hypothetical protein